MALNLLKNKESLQHAWKEVVDDKNDVNWALFGYDGQTFDLKLIGKGDGGLEEMVEDLNNGKIMYAFCRVIDPKTSLHKFVLINWQGEGAPSDKKGKCANHVQDVKNFFKGAHVTINARTDDDVDPEIVMEQVVKATGSSYSFKERSGPTQDHKPVGSVYKRTIPAVEINPAERDKFWEKEEAEERRRIEEEHRKAEEGKKRIEEERRQRELKDTQRRDEEVKKRTKSISELRAAENASSGGDDEKKKWKKQVEEDAREEAERKNRGDSSRRERTEEAQALISKRTINARAIFEQNTAAGQMSTIGVKNNGSQLTTKESLPIKTEETNGTNGNSSPSINSPRSTTSSPPYYQSPLSPEDRSPPPSPAPESSHNSYRAPCVSNGTSEAATSNVPLPNSYTKNLLKENLPKRQESDSEQEEQDWETPTNDFVASGRKEYVESKLVSDVHDNSFTEGQAHAQLAFADGNSQGTEQPEDSSYLQEQGLTARALYDYQAADDTEISFNPDDILTNIDQVDEGWWQGLAPDGTYGLFPANYVELYE